MTRRTWASRFVTASVLLLSVAMLLVAVQCAIRTAWTQLFLKGTFRELESAGAINRGALEKFGIRPETDWVVIVDSFLGGEQFERIQISTYVLIVLCLLNVLAVCAQFALDRRPA